MKSVNSLGVSLGKLQSLLFATAMVGAVGMAHAANISKAELEDRLDSSLLNIEFDESVPGNLSIFRLTNPYRQVIDLPFKLDSDQVPLMLDGTGRVKSVRAISSPGRSRLVFETAQPYELAEEIAGNRLSLAFKGPKPYSPDAMQGALLEKSSEIKSDVSEVGKKPAAIADGPNLLSWSFEKRGEQEVFRLVFDRDDIPTDASLFKNDLKLKFVNANLGSGVPSKLDGSKGQLMVAPELVPGDRMLTLKMMLNKATHQVRQVDKVIEVVLSPLGIVAENPTVAVVPSAAQVKAAEDKEKSKLNTLATFSGKPITLNFKDADIRTVMQVFADFSKMNLVINDKVQGKVTVYLNEVPWDQALDIVLRTKGLVASQTGNVLMVSLPGDVMSSQLEAAAKRAQDDMEPLVSKVFSISYSKVADVEKLLRAETSQLLSKRSSVIADERTSQLIVQDTASRMERITAVVSSLDKPVRQVLIEARVILADTTVAKELGARVRTLDNRSLEFQTRNEILGGGGFIDTASTAQANLVYTLFTANGTRLISTELRALESLDKVKVVSNPRVVTSNKEKALIEQGTEIPYQIATSSGATATEFKKAILKLEVTPQIAPDGSVLMDVDVAKDSVGIQTPNGPAIDTRHVKTKVIVSDGGTVVLGGVFETTDNGKREKTPLLGDIPILGNLFKTKTDSNRKVELLIFLTPVLVKEL